MKRTKKQTKKSKSHDSKRSGLTKYIGGTVAATPASLIAPVVGTRYQFAPGSVRDSVRLRITSPAFQVATGGLQGGLAPGMRTYVRSSGTSYGLQRICSLLIHPIRPMAMFAQTPVATTYGHMADASWANGILPNLAVNFVYYRIHSLRLRYLPQSQTSASTIGRRMTLATTDDPFHPLIGYAAYKLGTSDPTGLPQENTLLEGANTMSFAAWLPFETEMKLTKSSEWMPTYIQLGGAISDTDPQTALHDAQVRSRFHGAITLLADASTGGGTEVLGIMYSEWDLELRELFPITIADNGGVPSAERKGVVPPSAEDEDDRLYERPDLPVRGVASAAAAASPAVAVAPGIRLPTPGASSISRSAATARAP